MGRDKLKSLTSKSDAVVLRSGELGYLRARAKLSAEDIAALERKRKKAALAAKSKARKERMAARAKPKKKVEENDIEAEDRERREGSLNKAQQARDEDDDTIKHLNQMILYAECAAIRDRQIEEKERRIQQEKEEDMRMFRLMEAERLRGIREIEAREEVRAMKREEDARILQGQIDARERRRQQELERQEKEGQRMLELIRENQRRAEAEIQAKIENAKRMNDEVRLANDAFRADRARRKREEEEEIRKIEQYLIEKEARERAEDERLAKIKAAKDAEAFRLRGLQEKAQDRRSEMDALRAKRYQQGRDRAWRLAEKEKQIRRQENLREIDRVRREQVLFKKRQSNEYLKEDQERYLRALRYQQVKQRQDDDVAERKRRQRVDIQDEVLRQMALKEARKKQERAAYLAEGDVVRKKLEDEKRRVDVIKMQKLREAKARGVPEKYHINIRKKFGTGK